MPRKARIDAPGALQHIIARGIERRKIFQRKADYADFFERLGKILNETHTCCLAFALIPNHFHLLLKTGKAPISKERRKGPHLKYLRCNPVFCSMPTPDA